MDKPFINKKSILILTSVGLFFIYNDKILNWYNHNIIDPFLSKVNVTESPACIGFYIMLVGTIVGLIQLYAIERKVAKNILWFCGITLSLYLYFRFFSGTYTFYAYNKIPQIKYADYFIVLFGGTLLVSAINNSIIYKSAEEGNPFLMDVPIKSEEKDTLGRKSFAKELANKISSKINDEDAGALAIGINGEWGSGKSSFIKMLEDNLKKKIKLIIHFKAWRSSSSSKIIEDFFDLLNDELTPYAPDLKQSLTKYAKTLTKIEESSISKVVDSITDNFIEDANNKNVQYDEINSCITKLKFQILIFIDDLDRLDKKEVIEVLRLIRNTASFNNLIYVVAYDKPYVEEAIKEFNPYNYKSFLQKIFQFEFALPKFSNNVLRELIKKNLKEHLDDNNFQLISKAIDSEAYRNEVITDYYIKTPRDVIRLVNSILFEQEKIKHEIHIMDFYYLQLIKLKYPLFHKQLFYKKNYIFYPKDGVTTLRKKSEENKNALNAFTEKVIGNINKAAASENSTEDPFLIDGYISTYFKDISETEKLEIISTILQLTIRKEENEIERFVFPNSIYWDKNFGRYFDYSLLASDISFEQFTKYRIGDLETYKNQIQEWIKEGKGLQIEFLIKNTKDFKTKIEWENQIQILVEFARIYDNYSNANIWYTVQIIDDLSYPKQNEHILFFNSKDEYKKYVFNFFEQADALYNFFSRVLYTVLKRSHDFILTKNDILELMSKYFIQYCETHEVVSTEFHNLYINASVELNFDAEAIAQRQRLKEKYSEYYKKNLTAKQLVDFISRVSSLDNTYKFNKDNIFHVFKDEKEFEEFLSSSTKLKEQKEYLEEFVQFYNQQKTNNNTPIQFDFKYLLNNIVFIND